MKAWFRVEGKRQQIEAEPVVLPGFPGTWALTSQGGGWVVFNIESGLPVTTGSYDTRRSAMVIALQKIIETLPMLDDTISKWPNVEMLEVIP